MAAAVAAGALLVAPAPPARAASVVTGQLRFDMSFNFPVFIENAITPVSHSISARISGNAVFTDSASGRVSPTLLIEGDATGAGDDAFLFGSGTLNGDAAGTSPNFESKLVLSGLSYTRAGAQVLMQGTATVTTCSVGCSGDTTGPFIFVGVMQWDVTTLSPNKWVAVGAFTVVGG